METPETFLSSIGKKRLVEHRPKFKISSPAPPSAATGVGNRACLVLGCLLNVHLSSTVTDCWADSVRTDEYHAPDPSVRS